VLTSIAVVYAILLEGVTLDALPRMCSVQLWVYYLHVRWNVLKIIWQNDPWSVLDIIPEIKNQLEENELGDQAWERFFRMQACVLENVLRSHESCWVHEIWIWKRSHRILGVLSLQRVIPNMYVCCMCVCLCVCRPSDYSFEHAFVVQFATNWKASSENWKFPFKDICGE